MQNLDSDATTSGGHAHRMGSEGDKADDVDTPPPRGGFRLRAVSRFSAVRRTLAAVRRPQGSALEL